MEFLLQLFADFLGTPSEDQISEKREEIKEKDIATEPVFEQKVKEENPVIFGLMQFH
jgi:hypothetical protein